MRLTFCLHVIEDGESKKSKEEKVVEVDEEPVLKDELQLAVQVKSKSLELMQIIGELQMITHYNKRKSLVVEMIHFKNKFHLVYRQTIIWANFEVNFFVVCI